jgi:hypothetical protein
MRFGPCPRSAPGSPTPAAESPAQRRNLKTATRPLPCPEAVALPPISAATQRQPEQRAISGAAAQPTRPPLRPPSGRRAQECQDGEHPPVGTGVRVKTEFPEDLRRVGFDRPLDNEQAVGDGGVRESLGDQREDLALAAGQAGERVLVAPAAVPGPPAPPRWQRAAPLRRRSGAICQPGMPPNAAACPDGGGVWCPPGARAAPVRRARRARPRRTPAGRPPARPARRSGGGCGS